MMKVEALSGASHFLQFLMTKGVIMSKKKKNIVDAFTNPRDATDYMLDAGDRAHDVLTKILKVLLISFFKGLFWLSVWIGKGIYYFVCKVFRLEVLDKKRFKEFAQSVGLVAQRGNQIITTTYKKSTDGIVLFAPHEVTRAHIEKNLESLSSFFKQKLVAIRELDGYTERAFLLLTDKLPARVSYDERPKNFASGFWLGKNQYGEDVGLDFAHTPCALIMGASGSGKSVLGNVILREAQRYGWQTYVIDGKGGLDWSHIVKRDEILVDFDEVADFYEKLVDEYRRRQQQFFEEGWKNWYEANNAGANVQPILVFMDEASDFFTVGTKKDDADYDNKKRILTAVAELCRKSRAFGIFQIFSLQASNAAGIPDYIRQNAGYKIAYALPSAEQSRVLFDSDIAYDSSLRHGKGVIAAPGQEPVVFRGAFIS